jgi:hypothetical protein
MKYRIWLPFPANVPAQPNNNSPGNYPARGLVKRCYNLIIEEEKISKFM